MDPKIIKQGIKAVADALCEIVDGLAGKGGGGCACGGHCHERHETPKSASASAPTDTDDKSTAPKPKRAYKAEITRTKRPRDPKPCAFCGEVFTPFRDTTRFCTKACAKKAARESKPRWTPEPMPCAHCGATFTPKTAFQKFCSRKCNVAAQIAARPRKVQEPKVCPNCGVTFTPTHKAQKFCTKACAHAFNERTRYTAVVNEPKKCAFCGKEFTPKNKKAKFCSDNCRANAHNAEKSKYRGPRPCEICGKGFIPSTPYAAKAKYCPDCRDEALRRSREKWRREHGVKPKAAKVTPPPKPPKPEPPKKERKVTAWRVGLDSKRVDVKTALAEMTLDEVCLGCGKTFFYKPSEGHRDYCRACEAERKEVQ